MIIPVRDVSHPFISLLSFSFFSLQADPPLGNPPAEGQTNFSLSSRFCKRAGKDILARFFRFRKNDDRNIYGFSPEAFPTSCAIVEKCRKY